MLQTKLPAEIKTAEDAKKLLTDLFNNGESYHCDDDANDCLEGIVTRAEGDLLNKLMRDIHDIKFDGCGFLLNIDPEYMPDIKDLDVETATELLEGFSTEKIVSWLEKIDSNLVMPESAVKEDLISLFWNVFNNFQLQNEAECPVDMQIEIMQEAPPCQTIAKAKDKNLPALCNECMEDVQPDNWLQNHGLCNNCAASLNDE